MLPVFVVQYRRRFCDRRIHFCWRGPNLVSYLPNPPWKPIFDLLASIFLLMLRKKKPTASVIVALYPITFLEPHTSALLHCAVAQQFSPTVSVHFLRNVVEDTGGALRLSTYRPIHIVLYISSCWVRSSRFCGLVSVRRLHIR